MEPAPASRAASALSAHRRRWRVTGAGNQREHDLPAARAVEILRRGVIEQSFVAKPTAYAPYGRQDEDPLHEAHAQLQARLRALRDVRANLRFVPAAERGTAPGSDDVAMASPPSSTSTQREAMAIVTRHALSTQPATDDWLQEGGIAALDGLETLFFGFLTPHELVAAGAVCQSWYALARRDAVWEPLLYTPVERYPLRAFLGFGPAPSVPAMLVYIIYRKVHAKLRVLDAKDKQPRQSPEALRFEEVALRNRRVGNHHHHHHHHDQDENNDNNGDEHDDDVPARLEPEPRRHRGWRGRTAAGTLARLRARSVHLVYPADEDLDTDDDVAFGVDERVENDGDDGDEQDADELRHRERRRVPTTAAAPATQRRMPGTVAVDEASEEDVVMLALDRIHVEVQPARPRSTSIVNACHRVRLHTWLRRRPCVSPELFRSFARQLLLALCSLELSGVTHSDVSTANIFVLNCSTATRALPHANLPRPENNQLQSPVHDGPAVAPLPLFQLYCRSAVNIWGHSSATQGPAPQVPQALPMPARLAVVEMLAQRHHQDEGLQRRLLAARAPARGQDGAALPAPSTASHSAMVRSYLQILCEVWSHGRVVSTNERDLPFLSLIFLHPNLVKSIRFRSFVEYAEYLMSTNAATPSRLLHHIFLQPTEAETGLRPSDARPQPSRLVIGRSSVRPISFASADEYRAHALAWHARYLHTRQPNAPPRPVAPSVSAALADMAWLSSPATAPSTLFGPAFFRDALNESRLPMQRFLSVVAPRTATSSWVHTLAVSQRHTLQQLDLSGVELPLSILLRELRLLTRLSHLRLPREILRDKNMEQFVAALWCLDLLPALQVMDDSVKKALDRMEGGYVTQLHIQSLYLHRGTTPLYHALSSPS